jgi:hypothetical protein
MATLYIQWGDGDTSDDVVVGSEEWLELEGRLEPDTLVWAEHMPEWVEWSEAQDSPYIKSGGEDTGEDQPVCSSLYYEGCDDEISVEDALTLVEDGTIMDETLVYSDQEAFPFGDWTAWKQCSYCFGVGEQPDGCCTSLYYEGCDDEISVEDALTLVEDGTIMDETLVYSDQEAFPFDGWTEWWACSYCFGVGEQPDGTSLYYEGGEDQVSTEAALEMVEQGTITDDTLIYSDAPAFPFDDWTAWRECSYCFGVGDAPVGGCATLYTSADGEEADGEEMELGALARALEDGSITDETWVYSNDVGFTHEGWTQWCDCKELFELDGGVATGDGGVEEEEGTEARDGGEQSHDASEQHECGEDEDEEVDEMDGEVTTEEATATSAGQQGGLSSLCGCVDALCVCVRVLVLIGTAAAAVDEPQDATSEGGL